MKRTLQPVTCQLCGETHPSNGIHTHLKYKHDGMTTVEYIKRYGDFRVNTKKSESLKDGKSVYKCLICGDDITYTATALSFHLIKKHGTSKDSYILKYLLDGKKPMCKCGCGEETKITSYDVPYCREYISGHNKSTLGFKFSRESRERMSKRAVFRTNALRESGLVEPRHRRSCVFNRVYGTIETYRSKLLERGVQLLSDESDIHTDGVELKFLCVETGKQFSQHLLDARSPYKKKTKSKYQDELVCFIRSVIPEADVIENTQKVLDNRKEIDVYIPSKKIAIEFDGLYYHAEVSGNKDKLYHLWKTENALSKGIRLVHIFEDEWILRRRIVEAKLKSILGVRDSRVVFARKCLVKEIDATTKNTFLNEFHIQGRDSSEVKLGLFFQSELVAVMTFSKPNVSKGSSSTDDFMELSRYATKCNVIGGAGKLIKYFVRNSNVKKIVTYADRRWSIESSNLYTSTGFSFVGKTQCNYFYLDGSQTRLHRFNFTKSKLVSMGGDPNKTEWQLMQESGYDRIWDCGHLKYEMILSA